MGRRRDVIVEDCLLLDVVRGVDVEGCLCCVVVEREEGTEDDEPNPDDVAKCKSFSCQTRGKEYQVEALREC